MCKCEKTSLAIIVLLMVIVMYIMCKHPQKSENLLGQKKPTPAPGPSRADMLAEVGTLRAKMTDLELLIAAKAQSLNVMQVWDRDIAKKDLRALEAEHAVYKSRYDYLRTLL